MNEKEFLEDAYRRGYTLCRSSEEMYESGAEITDVLDDLRRRGTGGWELGTIYQAYNGRYERYAPYLHEGGVPSYVYLIAY